MSRYAFTWFAFVFCLLSGCSKVPVTGRRQYNLVPDRLMQLLGASSYKQVLAEAKVQRGTPNHDRLRAVGKRISTVASQPKYDWRYSLIQDRDTINAWCLPGGKVAFYTGVLPVLRHEAGMAFVMGHEVGHAIAHHGAERLSQRLTALGGLAALYLYVDERSEMNDDNKALLFAALGVGTEVGVLLPFSRTHEKEADVIGMMFMARAGYPPAESIDVWTRMGDATGNSSVPAFISTHPGHGQRKENLRDWLPRAKKRYARSQHQKDSTRILWTASLHPERMTLEPVDGLATSFDP